jgi:hypothetical protein
MQYEENKAHLPFSPCGRGWLREAKSGEGYLSAGKNPSSGTDFVRAAFSHRGRRKKAYAAAVATTCASNCSRLDCER